MKKIKKLSLYLIIIMTLFAAFTGNLTKASAEANVTITSIKPTGYTHTGTAYSGTGYSAWFVDQPIDKMTLSDGRVGFCIEPWQLVNYTTGYKSSIEDKINISKIIYHGYWNTDQSNYNHAVTQLMIWEQFGYKPTSHTVPNYTARKQQVMNLINTHNDRPSFNGKSYTLDFGETLTLTDTNGVLSQFSNWSATGCKVSVSGNTLKITPTIDAPETISISANKHKSKFIGASYVYTRANSQKIYSGMLTDPIYLRITLNVNKQGSLEISKQDTNGTFIPNTSFKVSYNSDMSDPIGTYKTGSDGKVAIKELQAKKVYIQEISVPKPLVLDSSIKTVTIVPNETVTYKAKNEIQQAQITLSKHDSETGATAQGDAKLTGAEYDVYDSAKETVVDHLVSGTKDTTKKLPLGTYYLKETKAPEGYLLNDEWIEAVIEYAGQDKAVSVKKVTATDNVIKGKIAINKTVDADLINEESAPFVFDIVHDSTGTVVETLTVAKDESVESGLLPYGKYTIVEHSSVGYYDMKPIKVTIDENEKTYTFDVENKAREVAFSKTDVTTGKELPGATIKVYEKDNEDVIIDEWTSTEEVHIIKGLIDGKTYVMEEISAPHGFALAEKIEFTVEAKNEIQKVEMKDNMIVGKVGFDKIGKVFTHTDTWQTEVGTVESPVWTEMNLLGADITIYAAEDITLGNGITYYEKDEVVEVLTSDFETVFSKELPVGKYYWVETKAPIGYVMDTEKHHFEIEDNGIDEIQKVEAKLFNNRPDYKFDFTKTLEDWKQATGEEYLDVVFGIFTRDDTYDYMGNVAIAGDVLVATTGIDKDGHFATIPELPVGNYYVKELSTNAAYIIDETEYDFTISQSSDETVIIPINEGQPIANNLKDFDIMVNKVDSVTKKVIKSLDFKFTIYTDPECRHRVETVAGNTENGTAMFKNVNYGTWYIKETKAPKGYGLSYEIVKVVINEEGVSINNELVEANEEAIYSFVYENALLPSTGDTTNTTLWIGMSVTSLAVIFLVLRKRKNNAQ